MRYINLRLTYLLTPRPTTTNRNPNPEPNNTLEQSAEDYYRAKYDMSVRSGVFRLSCSLHPQTHHDKVVAVSAPPYCT